MITLDPRQLTKPQRVALVNGLVAPRPIAWVSTVGADDVANLAPFSFFNAFSAAPFTIGVGPGSREGVNKDSLCNIRETREFTVSVVTEELARRANLTSAELDPSINEWDLARLTPRAAATMRPPLVAESPASFECRVFTIVDLGEDDLPTNSLVIARVTRMHIAEDVVIGPDYHVNPDAIRLVGRMGGDLWATTRDRFSLPRPTVAEALAADGAGEPALDSATAKEVSRP